MTRLVTLEKSNTSHLSELQQQRERLITDFGNLKSALQNERQRAERNEDDLIAEIEFLEKKLAENLTLQETQKEEIQALREKFTLLEKEQRREDKGRQKSHAAHQKRFATLYKNILVSERAVDGFMELNEEMRLKAEEVIHQLDATPDVVTIKRKVFGRKNRETVFEVVFAYRGRLYFRRSPDRRVEIAAIGTKNSQARELEFLAGL
jgi:DNA gyrase/topoisomerase IV subunit A